MIKIYPVSLFSVFSPQELEQSKKAQESGKLEEECCKLREENKKLKEINAEQQKQLEDVRQELAESCLGFGGEEEAQTTAGPSANDDAVKELKQKIKELETSRLEDFRLFEKRALDQELKTAKEHDELISNLQEVEERNQKLELQLEHAQNASLARDSPAQKSSKAPETARKRVTRSRSKNIKSTPMETPARSSRSSAAPMTFRKLNAMGGDSKAKIATLNKELRRTMTKVESLEKGIRIRDKEIDKLKNSVKDKQEKLRSIHADRAAKDTAKLTNERELKKLERKCASLENEVSKMRASEMNAKELQEKIGTVTCV